jgi:hypothetical protein
MKKLKKMLAVALAVGTLSSISAMNVGATGIYQESASSVSASKNWSCRRIAGGAPFSADRTHRFYIYYSSGGFNAKCQTLTSTTTTRTVTADSTNYTITGPNLWNTTNASGTYNRIYANSGSSHVNFNFYCSNGTNIYATGIITRV